jgi:uncharacterized repeat protein (TIGR01451 family)
MADEQVRAGKVRLTQRWSFRLVAAAILMASSAGAYVWAKRGPAESAADGAAQPADVQKQVALTPLQPIPMTERPDAMAPAPVLTDAYGGSRLRDAEPHAGHDRPQGSSIRLMVATAGDTAVSVSDAEPPGTLAAPPAPPESVPRFDRNSAFLPPTNPTPDREPAPAPPVNHRLSQAAQTVIAERSDAQPSPAEPVALSSPQGEPTTAPAPAPLPAAAVASQQLNRAPTPVPEPAASSLLTQAAVAAPPPAQTSFSASPRSAPATFSSARLPAAPAASEGQPGAQQLEGTQTPSLAVEKAAPQEIQVGRQATFQLKVRNVGRVAAHDVVVLDRVPKGTQLVTATPQFTQTPEGQLLWHLGTLQPGDETVVTMQLLPLTEGEVGSVAQVLFQAQASARSVCTKPQLTLTHTGPQKVLIGETVAFDITVANSGTGAATGVILEEDVPEGLAHQAGNQLEYEIGKLAPGETRKMRLTLKAAKAGQIENVLLVRGDGNLVVKDSISLEVIAPSLQVALSGPKLRYVEREATYEVAVSNPGTAPAKEVALAAYLPKGMKFVAADHQGQYEPRNHAVYWSLEQLPPNQTGVAKVTVLPVETGEQKLNAEVRAELGLKHNCEKSVQVESTAELQFTVADSADPIEVGTDTTYRITLTNRGSNAATNIRLAVGLPPQLKPLGGDGPTRVAIQGQQVSVDALARLGPGEEALYKLKVQGLQEGPQRIQVQLVTDETPVPVTREEITRVYLDR